MKPRDRNDYPAVDLVTLVVLTLLCDLVFLFFRPEPLVRLLFVPFFLVGPGYALVSVFFPRRLDHGLPPVSSIVLARDAGPVDGTRDTVVRFVLSVGFSIVVIGGVGLALVVTPVGYSPRTLLAGLTLVIVVCALTGAVRRRSVPMSDRFDPRLTVGLNQLIRRERLTNWDVPTIVIVCCLLIAASGVWVAYDRGQPGFTEIYLLTPGEDGSATASDFPTTFTAGESRTLILGINNREHQTVDYSIVVMLQRVRTNEAETVLIERKLAEFAPRVENGETWRKPHEIAPSMLGERLRLTYFLYEGSAPANPTVSNAKQHVHLWVSVTSEGPSRRVDQSSDAAAVRPSNQTILTSPTPEQGLGERPLSSRYGQLSGSGSFPSLVHSVT